LALSQVRKSLRRIVRNPHIATLPALCRYAAWQGRRVLGAFPTELPLSSSVLIAPSGHCGVSALVNSCRLYDYNNMSLIRMLLSGGGNFIDIGANIGSYTLIAAEQPRARILAIEPHPQTFAYLSRNVARNGYENVRLVRAAIGEREGSVTITDTPGSAVTHITSDGSGLAVPLRRMDSLLAETGLSPDLVKLDVEGFELGVLQGFRERLREVKVLIIEMNDLGEGNAAEVWALLERAGFSPPRYFDARARELVATPVAIGEDPVCVHGSYLPKLALQMASASDL
jgi:FkbM family methyltransferase